MHNPLPKLTTSAFPAIHHKAPDTLQVNLISVDWRGFVYNCDFNQMLGLPFGASSRPRTHLKNLINQDLCNTAIAVADHCYGCTAGQGSSCGGVLN